MFFILFIMHRYSVREWKYFGNFLFQNISSILKQFRNSKKPSWTWVIAVDFCRVLTWWIFIFCRNVLSSFYLLCIKTSYWKRKVIILMNWETATSNKINPRNMSSLMVWSARHDSHHVPSSTSYTVTNPLVLTKVKSYQNGLNIKEVNVLEIPFSVLWYIINGKGKISEEMSFNKTLSEVSLKHLTIIDCRYFLFLAYEFKRADSITKNVKNESPLNNLFVFSFLMIDEYDFIGCNVRSIIRCNRLLNEFRQMTQTQCLRLYNNLCGFNQINSIRFDIVSIKIVFLFLRSW